MSIAFKCLNNPCATANATTRNRALLAAIVAWLITIGVAFGLLTKHANSAGAAAEPPPKLDAATATYRLLLFLHPHCPCSRATLLEVGDALARTSERVDVTIHVFRPFDKPEQWSETDISQSASRLPHGCVKVDVDAQAAREFGAVTSGQVFVYDPTGRLVFSGGVTGSRGHEGPNRGSEALTAILCGADYVANYPVFGCPLYAAGN